MEHFERKHPEAFARIDGVPAEIAECALARAKKP
jgi:hypothetical protein